MSAMPAFSAVVIPQPHYSEDNTWMQGMCFGSQGYRIKIGDWSLENSFHWMMDVVFGEDHSQVCLDEAPENFAVIRHIAMNLLKQHPSKQSLKRKRFRAALDDAFLMINSVSPKK
jgi:hypothetical protein